MTVDPHTTDSAGADPAESVPFETFLEPEDEASGEAADEMPAEATRPGWFRRARLGFRHWRRTRPFWGGLLILLGGGEILLSERGPLRVMVHVGAEGMAGYIMPAVMLLCGVLLWVTPTQRLFYSILAILMSLGSFVTANLGGFFLGLILGLIGGSLAFAWAPARTRAAARRRDDGVAVPVQATGNDHDSGSTDTQPVVPGDGEAAPAQR